MATYEAFYDINPVARLDQNTWDERQMEIAQRFREQPVIYTPLVDWDTTQSQTGARKTMVTEMLEGDTDFDEIPFSANYIGVTTGVDSRSRWLQSKRYGDKVQLHESENIFQQWKLSGGRDWRPLLRGLLGTNVIRKHEMLSRNAYMSGPKTFWTYGGNATDFASLGSDDKISLDIVNKWRLRLGNTGAPVIPGDMASAKLAIVPPGCVYDFQTSLATASQNEASMWRDAMLYRGDALRYELGAHKGVRFVEVPNDRYGQNLSVLYNCGAITGQYGVTAPILMGDGSPDPETTAVDDVWYIGQKDVTHYIQMESGADMTKYAVNEWVTIHTVRTSDFGVTDGVDFRSGKTVTRRVVASDNVNKRLQFDRPVMFNYDKAFSATPVSGSAGMYYAFVTAGKHVGFCLVLGSRGGIMGSVARPLMFHEPRPIDDFDSVWRFTWDEYAGYNIWEPNLFECHFVSVTLPKVGGIIAP